MKTMKKIITVILSAILTLSCGLFLFGCADEEEKVYLDAVIRSEIDGVEEEIRFRMDDDCRLKKFTFECVPEGSIRVSANTIKRKSDDYALGGKKDWPVEKFEQTWVNVDKAGVYTCRQSYELYGDFVIEITLIDNRPIIEVELFPAENCLLNIDDEVFIYSKDSVAYAAELLSVRYFCDGQEMGVYTETWSLQIYLDCVGKYEENEWVLNTEIIADFKKGIIGVYGFEITRSCCGLWEGNYKDYQPFERQIIIIIV